MHHTGSSHVYSSLNTDTISHLYLVNINKIPDKTCYRVIFLVFPQNRMLWVLYKAPQRGTSNKYPQQVLGEK